MPEEREEIMEIIEKELSGMTTFSSLDIDRLRKVLHEHLSALGMTNSPARTSKLHPIECQLKDPNAEILCNPFGLVEIMWNSCASDLSVYC